VGLRLPLYQVDAFTGRLFGGNPAAVCLLEQWLPDATLQAIAAENNLSETAFLVPDGDRWRLRWFTPAVEVALCGHATLASAHVLLRMLHPDRSAVTFQTRSGLLTVEKAGDLLRMDFPALPFEPAPPHLLADALGAVPEAGYRSDDLMAVFAAEEQVRALRPCCDRIAELDCRGVIATAPGCDCDFVSRFFAPRAGSRSRPSRYQLYSYRRQQRSFPHRPVIFVGSAVCFWILAMSIVMPPSSLIQPRQQRDRPQWPMSPTRRA